MLTAHVAPYETQANELLTYQSLNDYRLTSDDLKPGLLSRIHVVGDESIPLDLLANRMPARFDSQSVCELGSSLEARQPRYLAIAQKLQSYHSP